MSFKPTDPDRDRSHETRSYDPPATSQRMSNQLLSRDVAAGILNGTYDEDAGARVVAGLLRLAGSGRLVDREAIDYEAAADRLNDAFGDRENRLRIVHNLVDAAIGDGDE